MLVRQRGKPAAPEVFTAPAFVEPFLKACSPGVLTTAHQVCKTWSTVATCNRNVLWQMHVLRCWPAPWLQCDGQEEYDWLQRYKVLSQGPQCHSETEAAQDHHAVLKELQGSYEFFLTAHSAEMVEGDEGQLDWLVGEFVFSLPLKLQMESLYVEMGDMGGGHDTPDGLVLVTTPMEQPICLPFKKFGEYHSHLIRDLAIHVKRTKDGSIAHMLTLRGCEFYHEGDGYYHWEQENRVPFWLKCLTHGSPDAGMGSRDEFEPLLHLDDNDDEEDIANNAANLREWEVRSSTMKFEFKRRTVAAETTDYYPGYAVGPCCVPMCVCDMPDVLKMLTWS